MEVRTQNNSAARRGAATAFAAIVACGGVLATVLVVDRGVLPRAPRPTIAAVAALAPLPLPESIDPDFEAQVERCFLPVAEAYGYDLRITSAYRTKEEQDAVFRQGRTENGHVVTEVEGGRSLHNFGLAVDVADRDRGYRIDWDRLGRIGAYCGLEQNEEGDQAHFAYRAGLTIEQLALGYRPPPIVRPCALLDERADAGDALTPQDLAACGADEL